MSKNYWFVSDHHFGHDNMLNFVDGSGNKIRQFDDISHMNETLIERHNSLVNDIDHVYFGGDVCFDNDTFHRIMPRLKGKKRLILGNHDHFRMDEYYKYFKKIVSWRQFSNFKHRFTFCHYPLHESAFNNRVKFCVHGHIHKNLIKDGRYINVCVEHTNYSPVSVDDLMKEMDKRTKE